MHVQRFIVISLLVASSFAASRSSSSRGSDDESNPVLRAARSFADGGEYNTKWAGTGCPEEIRFKNTTILKKADTGTYCCGFTFAVAMRAASAEHLLDDKTPAELKKFQKEWYGATKDPENRERTCTFALVSLGIGKAVNLADAKPGDFVQFWRTSKNGHSVVFLNWVEEAGKPVGIHYRSSQTSTKGIGDHTEYFSDAPNHKEGKIDRERTYFARLNAAVPATANTTSSAVR